MRKWFAARRGACWTKSSAGTFAGLRCSDVLAKLSIFPADRTLDPDLKDELMSDCSSRENGFCLSRLSEEKVAGIYVE